MSTKTEYLVPAPRPLELFSSWLDDALKEDFIEPYAMTLATATTEGRPSARQVLLKSFDENGFVFYTNYESRKGREISENPYASAVIWWDRLHRQVRIEGVLEKVSAELSDKYFATRPRGSQISACISPQSREIDIEDLLAKSRYMESELHGEAIKRPEYWGGYVIQPNRIEFWQGKPNRLHDRLIYILQNDKWITQRLGP